MWQNIYFDKWATEDFEVKIRTTAYSRKGNNKFYKNKIFASR